MGISRHLKHKERSNYPPSVREISCWSAIGRRLVNRFVAFYSRSESSLPESVCWIFLDNGSAGGAGTSLLNTEITRIIGYQINPGRVMCSQLSTIPDLLSHACWLWVSLKMSYSTSCISYTNECLQVSKRVKEGVFWDADEVWVNK